MPSIFIQDDTIRRAKKGISYDFLAPDGSENRDAGGIFRHSSWYERSLRGNTYGMRLAYYNL